MTAHTTVQKGKRVIIKMKNGIRVDGKFVEKKGSWVYVDTEHAHVKLWAGNIKSLVIDKTNYNSTMEHEHKEKQGYNI